MANNETENKAKGKLNQAVGATREKVGDMSGNQKLEMKGREQHAKGDAQEMSGKVRGAVNDASNQARDAVGKAAARVKDAVGR